MSNNAIVKPSYHPLNPIGYIKRNPLIFSAIVVGGLSIAAYLAYTNRFFPGADYYPEKLQSAIFTPKQILARCILRKPSPQYLEEAVNVFKCYTKQTKWEKSETFYCKTLVKDLFRKVALEIHPDKAGLEDQKLFQNAMQVVVLAKDTIQKRACSQIAKIARCIEYAPIPHDAESAKKLLQCTGEEIPQTCVYLNESLEKLVLNLRENFPERNFLARKIQFAYEYSKCYSIPKSLVDWWTKPSE